jgi:general secretion pathway protein L
MLVEMWEWWLARMSELGAARFTRRSDADVLQVDGAGLVTSYRRHKGRTVAVPLTAVLGGRRRRTIVLRAPDGAVLTKHHTVPAVRRSQMHALLRHEIARITPFAAPDLFWRWDIGQKLKASNRLSVVFTMVPRAAMMPALKSLHDVGLDANGIEIGPEEQPILLPKDTVSQDASAGRSLAYLAAGLVAIAVLQPFVSQSIALYRTESAIAELQPAIAQVESFRRRIAAKDAGGAVIEQEANRATDLLRLIATVTQLLPDDSYLTSFAVRDRQISLTGQSSSAAKLIADLSENASIERPSFAAPVTRPPGVMADVFTIRAGLSP